MKSNFKRTNMQKFSTLLIGRLSFLFLLFFLYSCSDKCDGIDCLDQGAFEFTLKSASTGEDLLFGSNPQLKASDIEVFYMKDGVEQTADVHVGTRSVMVSLVNGVEEYHVRALDKTDIVNVQFQRTGSSDCCPSATQINEITVNGGAGAEEAGVVILLR